MRGFIKNITEYQHFYHSHLTANVKIKHNT